MRASEKKGSSLGEFREQRLLNLAGHYIFAAGFLLALLALGPAVGGRLRLTAVVLAGACTLFALSWPLFTLALTMRRMRALRDISARIDLLSQRIGERDRRGDGAATGGSPPDLQH